MMRFHFLLLNLILIGAAQAATGPQCTEDIILINGEDCMTPCCYQDPPNSGHYTFRHNTVEKIDIRGNSADVLSVSFPNLVSVEKFIRISYNQPGSITKISFPSLRTTGALEIIGNPGLVEVNLPRLGSIDNDESAAYLKIQSNANLKILSAPRVHNISASEYGNAFIQIRYNQALEEIEFPILRTIEAGDDYSEAYVFIQNNDLVRHINMNGLQRLSAGFESISWIVIDEMLNLELLSFHQLTELLPTGGAYNFSELTIGHSPRLSEFVFPNLERVSLLQLSSLKRYEEGYVSKLEGIAVPLGLQEL